MLITFDLTHSPLRLMVSFTHSQLTYSIPPTAMKSKEARIRRCCLWLKSLSLSCTHYVLYNRQAAYSRRSDLCKLHKWAPWHRKLWYLQADPGCKKVGRKKKKKKRNLLTRIERHAPEDPELFDQILPLVVLRWKWSVCSRSFWMAGVTADWGGRKLRMYDSNFVLSYTSLFYPQQLLFA